MRNEDLNSQLKQILDDDLEAFLEANAKMQLCGAIYGHDYKFESGAVIAITRKGQILKKEAGL